MLFTRFGFSIEDLDKKYQSFQVVREQESALLDYCFYSHLFLDEPTNHLDIQTVEWLEGYLQNILMR